MRDVGFAPLEVSPYTEGQGEHCARLPTQNRQYPNTIQPILDH